MFTKEELEFIKTMVTDELCEWQIKRNRIDDYSKVKEFDSIIQPRKEFMKKLLIKINNYK